MWENAINCWTDLQHYRGLFYQEGLDPYRVQREAQVSAHCDPQPPTSGAIYVSNAVGRCEKRHFTDRCVD